MSIDVVREGAYFRTKGMRSLGQLELAVACDDLTPATDCKTFLRYVVEHVKMTGRRIGAGETSVYGFWVTKFVDHGVGYLEAWECAADGEAFVPGIRLAGQHWREQHRACERLGAPFTPPAFGSLVIVSEGVREGERPIQGVRYAAPSHMSGWFLSTERYKGDTKTLKTVHAFHVAVSRPDVARYIALPYGFRFELGENDDVWFDKTVAEQPIP